jgi:hypothetical protein
MSVESVRLRLWLVAPLRLVLGGVWLGAARAAGGSSTATLLAFAAGAFGMAVFISNDPRARFRTSGGEPDRLPPEAIVAPAWRHAVHACFPSTVGVAVLAAATLAFNQTLTALLGGVLAGLGVAALLAAYSISPRLYVDPRRGAVFRK